MDTSDGVHGGAGSLGFWGQTAAGSVTSDGQVWTAIDYVYVVFATPDADEAQHKL